MKGNFFVISIALLYIGSLFLPGIIFEPSTENNPKFSFCASANNDGWVCSGSPENYTCGQPSVMITNPISKEQINAYCGTDWNTATAEKYEGWFILAFGWAGIFVANFAWYANIFLLIAFASLLKMKAQNAFNLYIDRKSVV